MESKSVLHSPVTNNSKDWTSLGAPNNWIMLRMLIIIITTTIMIVIEAIKIYVITMMKTR